MYILTHIRKIVKSYIKGGKNMKYSFLLEIWDEYIGEYEYLPYTCDDVNEEQANEMVQEVADETDGCIGFFAW